MEQHAVEKRALTRVRLGIESDLRKLTVSQAADLAKSAVNNNF